MPQKKLSHQLANLIVWLMLVMIFANAVLFFLGVYVPNQSTAVIIFLGLLFAGIYLRDKKPPEN